MPPPPRPAVRRTFSYPPAIKPPSNGPGSVANQSSPPSQTAVPNPTKPQKNVHAFTDFDEHPEEVFLSPMHEYEYEYDDWASDSDDDDNDEDDFDWDAGITDFALFDNERRQAQQSRAPIDSRWDDFVARQQSALDRAMMRTQAEEANQGRFNPPADDIPGLTPDTSPDLHDDLDVDGQQVTDKQQQQQQSPQQQPRPLTPTTKGPGNQLTVTVTPPSPTLNPISDEHADEDTLFLSPLTISASPPKHSQPARPSPLKTSITSSPPPAGRHMIQRPGLRHARTLSGKLHSWRRPSWHIYRLDEEEQHQPAAATVASGERESSLRRVDRWEDLRGRRM